MPPWKVVSVAVPNERAQIIMGMAPPEVAVTLVDVKLPDAEKVALCGDADAVISSDVSEAALRNCPGVKAGANPSAGYDMLNRSAGRLGIWPSRMLQ